jgi:hypothetical protein
LAGGAPEAGAEAGPPEAAEAGAEAGAAEAAEAAKWQDERASSVTKVDTSSSVAAPLAYAPLNGEVNDRLAELRAAVKSTIAWPSSGLLIQKAPNGGGALLPGL